jgi:hypothetical protein
VEYDHAKIKLAQIASAEVQTGHVHWVLEED